jgi:4-amino-4-deoxy-L-arabinose transferase-like glycosyltransferase
MSAAPVSARAMCSDRAPPAQPAPEAHPAQRLRTAWWLHPACRCCLFAAALIVGGAVVCFYRLEERMLLGDEAAFAATTDRMRATGDWVVPYIWEDRPHLNATPLYNWLTLLTFDWLDGNARYRFWSAFFGIACALAAFGVGARLFRPEVGFLAGALLLCNHHFLFWHGIRDGIMDVGLACFVTMAVFFYAGLLSGAERTKLHWCLIGACFGAAWLIKPPVLGTFFFAAMTLHHWLASRDVSWWARLRGPLLALCVAALVAAPWYVLLWRRVGDSSLRALFIYNSVQRALTPRDNTGISGPEVLRNLWESSRGFRLAGPAFAWAALAAALGWRRQAWMLLAWITGSFALALASSGHKWFHYVYPIYPLLSVMIAALLCDGAYLAALPQRWRGRLHAGALALGVFVACLCLYRDVKVARVQLSRTLWPYPGLVVKERLAGLGLAQDIRIVLYGFPMSHGFTRESGLAFHDYYYAKQLSGAAFARTVVDLNRLLDDGKPALVFVPPKTSHQQMRAQGLTICADREVWLRSEHLPYPLFAFHGALDHPDLEEALRVYEIDVPKLH